MPQQLAEQLVESKGKIPDVLLMGLDETTSAHAYTIVATVVNDTKYGMRRNINPEHQETRATMNVMKLMLGVSDVIYIASCLHAMPHLTTPCHTLPHLFTPCHTLPHLRVPDAALT